MLIYIGEIYNFFVRNLKMSDYIVGGRTNNAYR